ncbi:MAG: FmdB family zinc ribbon protein [Steroidobacteraceae bacterium]
MPFYEYECSSCKFYTEVLQKITDARLKRCPSCGKNTLQKLVSAPVFRLKGSGWYETDFKTDKESKHNLARAEPSESSDAGKQESAKDAKPGPSGESKTDAKATEAKPGGSKPSGSKTGGSKTGGSKPAAESRESRESPGRRTVSLSRKTATPQRTAKSRSPRAARPGTKVRTARKARR